MRRWVQLASKLYPDGWRARYGTEMEALLDDVPPRWSDVLDILREAITMRLTDAKSCAKLAGAVGVAGAIVAFGFSLAMPKWYLSSAVVTARDSDVTLEVLGRASLAELMTRPLLDLYRAQRRREPLARVVDAMRRDLRIRPEVRTAGTAQQYTIEFEYPNALKARAVVLAVAARLQTPGNLRLEEPASVSEIGVRPGRAAVAGIGLGLGLLAGLITWAVRRRNLRWSLQVAGCTLAGLLVAVAATKLLPHRYVSSAVVRARDGFALDQEARADRFLTALILRQGLYDRDPRALLRLRSDLKVVRLSPPGASLPAYSISFTYQDRERAQEVVRETITMLNRWDEFPPEPYGPDTLPRLKADVIDAATLPDTPVSPSFPLLASAGAVLGLGLGLLKGR
jgi:hypothetical protein